MTRQGGSMFAAALCRAKATTVNTSRWSSTLSELLPHGRPQAAATDSSLPRISTDDVLDRQLEQEMHSLLLRADAKIPNSTSYRKLYRRFAHVRSNAVESILRRTLGPSVDPEATKALTFSLGADGSDRGVMPDFTNAALAGYTLSHFGRARLMSDFLVQTEPVWLEERVSELFGGGGGRGIRNDGSRADGACSRTQYDTKECRVASLGGGPGYDFLSLATLSDFRDGPAIRTVVYEYERTWRSIVEAMGDAYRSLGDDAARHSCGFDPCDITLPLDAVDNAAVGERSDATDVYVCSYCIAENAVALGNQKYKFFADLFEEVPVGTLFFFAETTHRCWPHVADLATRAGMRVSFPHLSGSGKVGWQLVVMKDDRSHFGMAARDLDLYRRFRKDHDAHMSRLSHDWRRSVKKIRGVK